MAIAATILWEFNQAATANMVNAGGFNPANANFLTNLTTDTNTGNTASPVISSASYNFVAGDVGAWIYILSGTNWYANRFYKIASVASNKATLMAAAGEALTLNTTTNLLTANSDVGVASVGTPTGGTFGVDYSQGTAAILTNTDGTASGTTTFTSALSTFTNVMVGNFLHITASTGLTVGWYEIVQFTDATNVVLDRTPGTGSATTFYVGGALSLNSTLDDDFFEQIMGGNTTWFKYSATAYICGEAVSVVQTNGTGTAHNKVYGYKTLRGDNPAAANRPAINAGALGFVFVNFWTFKHLIIYGTTTVNFSVQGTDCWTENCKLSNTSTTASRTAASVGAGNTFKNNEVICQNGNGVGSATPTSTRFWGNYIHDCAVGVAMTSATSAVVAFNLFENCKTAGVTMSNTIVRHGIYNNTFYGAETTPVGIGVQTSGVTATALAINNNIFYGLATGIEIATVQQDSVVENYNTFFNNTTNRTRIAVGLNSIALNPTFTGATQITGSTATTSGSVLTQSGGDFSTVEDNVDYLRVVSGTGVTVATYLITAHTGTTLTTNNALGTSSAGDVVYVVYTGHNFEVGTNMKAVAFPGAFQAGFTTGYLDAGAAQRVEPAASSGGSGIIGGGSSY